MVCAFDKRTTYNQRFAETPPHRASVQQHPIRFSGISGLIPAGSYALIIVIPELRRSAEERTFNAVGKLNRLHEKRACSAGQRRSAREVIEPEFMIAAAWSGPGAG